MKNRSVPNIEHVVVLMLENRSFDCMLGQLYPKTSNFDGLDGTESN
jgi:phospholipase C